MKQVIGYAPATVGNVACGFDVLGFALTHPGDKVTLSYSETNSDSYTIEINSIKGDNGILPTDVKKNTAGITLIKFIDHLLEQKKIEPNFHLSIDLEKNLPLSSGMGSSASSAAAALIAANHLFGEPLTKKALVEYVMEGEYMACGSYHADNAAPAILGNFVLIRSYTPLDLIEIPAPKNLYATLINPQIEIKTADARSILKDTVPMKDAIRQWGNVGALVNGLLTEDMAIIGRSLEDFVAEPYRAPLIPYFYDVKNAAMEAGALGGSIAGSGPSLFTFSDNEKTAKEVGLAMQQVFSSKAGLNSKVWVSQISSVGAEVIEAKQEARVS